MGGGLEGGRMIKGSEARRALRQDLSQRFAYDECGRLEYIGETLPRYQDRTSNPVWRIRKIAYVEGSGCPEDMLGISWANSSTEFNFSWEERETYDY